MIVLLKWKTGNISFSFVKFCCDSLENGQFRCSGVVFVQFVKDNEAGVAVDAYGENVRDNKFLYDFDERFPECVMGTVNGELTTAIKHLHENIGNS